MITEDKEEKLGYYVEFPMDDGEKEEVMKTNLSEAEEMSLVQVVNKVLSLKRAREEDDLQKDTGFASEWEGSRKKRLQVLCLGNFVELQKVQTSADKAEEAGQNMPHQGP